MYKNGDTCPVCGEGTLRGNVITEKFDYKGQSIDLNDYAVMKCDKCGDSIVEPETLKRTEKPLRDFKHKIDGLLTSDEIRGIRERFAMTQAEFAGRLYITRISLNRYENGRETQSKTLDALIRLIAKETPLKFNMQIGAYEGAVIVTGYSQERNEYDETQDDYEKAA